MRVKIYEASCRSCGWKGEVCGLSAIGIHRGVERRARIHNKQRNRTPTASPIAKFSIGWKPHLWLRSLPAGENSLHILGRCLPVAGPRFPARSSHLQLLPLDMLSYVEVSSVHGCRILLHAWHQICSIVPLLATRSDASIPFGLGDANRAI